MADWVGQLRVSNSSRDNTLSNRGDACARFLGYIRCCVFSTGKRFSKVSDFILLSTFVCVTKVINIKLIIPGYQVGLRVDPKLFQNVHRYHNHWSHTKNHLHKNGWRRRCARARRSGPTNSRLVRAAAASQGNWSRSEVILPRGASTRLTIFEKQLFHRGTSSGVLLDRQVSMFCHGHHS